MSVCQTFIRKEIRKENRTEQKTKQKLIHPHKQTARQQDKARQVKARQDEIYIDPLQIIINDNDNNNDHDNDNDNHYSMNGDGMKIIS